MCPNMASKLLLSVIRQERGKTGKGLYSNLTLFTYNINGGDIERLVKYGGVGGCFCLDCHSLAFS